MSKNFNKHNHGGQLSQASQQYGIPLSDWLELSTGISPFTYPLSQVPDECWQRLPESNDGLESAAADYYGSEFLLPVSGSQEAIQKLPLLFPKPCNIGIITPAYHSHQQAWQKAGHNVIFLAPEEIDNAVFSSDKTLDILLIVNPTNPSTLTYAPYDLLRWYEKLASQNAYLIVDEAFIDCTPEHSLIERVPKPGLIVLRSIGKFFGLAGIRLGFVWAEEQLLHKLATLQEDWSVSHPARWAGKVALADRSWQQQQRSRLTNLSLRLTDLLQRFLTQYNSNYNTTNDSNIYSSRGVVETTKERSDADPKGEVKPNKSGGVSFDTESHNNISIVRSTLLFAYFEHPDVLLIHQALAQQGILTRLFIQSAEKEHEDQKSALRFGLVKNDEQCKRLELALNNILDGYPND